MMTKIATCLLALSLLPACTTTTTTTAERQPSSRMTMEQRLLAQGGAAAAAEPAPPAEGPEDIPAEAPVDPNRNPGLLPTPLLRANAAGGL